MYMHLCLFICHESYCSSWSCICFSSSVGVVVLTVTVKFLGLGGGGGGCFLFLLFWGTPKTWTYAMLTCIVFYFTLLYSGTSQTCVHDNVWLKT